MKKVLISMELYVMVEEVPDHDEASELMSNLWKAVEQQGYSIDEFGWNEPKDTAAGDSSLTIRELYESVPAIFIRTGDWYNIHEDYMLQVIDDHDGESWATVRGIELVDVVDDDDDEPFWIIGLTDDDCMSRPLEHGPLSWRIFQRRF